VLARHIALAPLYFAASRSVVARQGAYIVVDDHERMQFEAADEVVEKTVRFRTLGCWPVTGADRVWRIRYCRLFGRNEVRQGAGAGTSGPPRRRRGRAVSGREKARRLFLMVDWSRRTFKGCRALLATMHHKEKVIAPALRHGVGFDVSPAAISTPISLERTRPTGSA